MKSINLDKVVTSDQLKEMRNLYIKGKANNTEVDLIEEYIIKEDIRSDIFFPRYLAHAIIFKAFMNH